MEPQILQPCLPASLLPMPRSHLLRSAVLHEDELVMLPQLTTDAGYGIIIEGDTNRSPCFRLLGINPGDPMNEFNPAPL